MAFCRLAFALLVISVVQSYATVQVPVYLWGDVGRNSLEPNALSSIPFNEFGVILKQELEEDPFTVVFVEENLSVEDLSRKNDGQTLFPYLRAQIGDALYLPSVESPLRVLNKFADPEKVDHVKLTENGLSADIQPQGGKFLFINLKDAKEGESRADLLRRHNDFMQDMVSKLQERYKDVVAIYTAHYPSWTVPEHSRVRRQANSTLTAARTKLAFNGLLFNFDSVLFNDGTNEVVLSSAEAGSSVVNDTEMHSTIVFDNDSNVTLNFYNRGGYWLLENANFARESPAAQEELQVREDVFAILGFYYVCSSNLTLGTVNETNSYSLTFQNVKLQPFFVNNNTLQFSEDSFDCVGFFTSPIWAGLFVVSILLIIMFVGITMMLDIKTMDRFDDPKGKTITINAE